jgi:hypothetical protein
MNRTSVIMVIVAAASLLIASGDISSSFAQETGSLPANGCSNLKIVPLQYGDPSTDLPSCQQDCKSRYGVDRYTLQFGPGGRGGGGDTGSYYLYAQCIADCNRQFWNRFDKKMEEDK